MKAAETARRNLAHRLDRYLVFLEKREAQPGQREGDHLLRALDHLRSGTYDAGERDVMWADWASRQPDTGDPHPGATREALVKRLAEVLQGD